MATEEFKVEQNRGAIAPVSVDSSIAHVEETKRRALAEQQIIEKDSAASTDVNGSVEGSVYIDLGLEALGVKAAASLVQFADERMSDRAGINNAANNDSLGGLIGSVAKTIDDDILGGTTRQPGKYEGIYERAQIAASSLNLDKAANNTDKWGGTNKKIEGVEQTRGMSFRRDIEHELLPQIRGVELQQQAMLGHARTMAPGLSMDGPKSPVDFAREAEEIRKQKQWTERTEGGTWS